MRRNLIHIAQWAFTAAVLVFAGVALMRGWEKVGGRLAALHPHWGELALASVAVLGCYVVLIETWRRVLGIWDKTLPWPSAARIWFASSLGKYIPGNVWSIAALGVLARERGASGVAAAGSSVVINVINLVSGAAVVLAFAAQFVPEPMVMGVLVALAVGGSIAVPWILPRAVALAGRFTGKSIRLPRVPPATIWLTLAGTTIAWLGYGFAFWLFARAMVGDAAAHGRAVLYVAAYTAAYILGFVTPVAPAGLGVREFAIVEALARLGLTSIADATIIALASRVWLTILEVAPGIVALALTHARRQGRKRSS